MGKSVGVIVSGCCGYAAGNLRYEHDMNSREGPTGMYM